MGNDWFYEYFINELKAIGRKPTSNMQHEVVDSLPSSGNEQTIYFVKNDSSSSNNHYDEYVWISSSSTFEKIGSTQISEAPVQSVNGQTGAVELTAEDVGAISQDDLQEATNNALAQAKASGEFDGADGKSAYQYAQDGGYTGTEAEFAAKLASGDNFYIDLVGSDLSYTCPITMDDIKAAYNAGYNLVCRCTVDELTVTLPLFFSMPNANSWFFSSSGALNLDDMEISPQSFTVAIIDGSVVAQTTEFTTKDDRLPNPNALTFTGAVTGSYDGSAAMTVNIPSAVTDDHINSLIDTKLGVIENGAY